MADAPGTCQWIDLREALTLFARAEYGTQGQRHIRPLHWYVACRLCLEGGFDPDEITPRPPFRVKETGSGRTRRRLIEFDPEAGGSGEQTILGGLKTKQVDVVVTKPNIGPVVAVSMKGTLNAFRNLTNRMEEAGGDCTNLHLTYPSLVYAFWSVLRANRPGPVPPDSPKAMQTADGLVRTQDLALDEDGGAKTWIERYHLALCGLTGRDGIRNDVSKYEAVALTLVDVEEGHLGEIYDGFPPPESPLHFGTLLETIYRQYDMRFVYQAPDLKAHTLRKGWHEDSPALQDWKVAEYEPRLQGEEGDGDNV